MDAARALLDDLTDRGFRLSPAPKGKVSVQPASKLTANDREAILRLKPDLLALLAPALPAPSIQESQTESPAQNIDPTVRSEIARIEPAALTVGWLPARLWNPAFWPAPRGLAAVLDGSDRIAEVTREWILIQKADGNQQRFFRCDG